MQNPGRCASQHLHPSWRRGVLTLRSQHTLWSSELLSWAIGRSVRLVKDTLSDIPEYTALSQQGLKAPVLSGTTRSREPGASAELLAEAGLEMSWLPGLASVSSWF